jgi:cell growth-regulating nucleolar protein
VLTKKKLDPHRNQCYGATYTCLDCMVHFYGTDYRSHTSCISEAQKYQGHLYKDKSAKGGKQQQQQDSNKRKSTNNNSSMVPRGAYVEDAPEGDDMHAIAIIDVPPRAPTPPPAPEALENINVFDFLVSDATPKGAVQAPEERRRIEHKTPKGEYSQQGWSYGNAPIEPSFQRWDSYNNLTADSQETQAGSLMPPPTSYVTPAPKEQRKKDRKAEKSTDKKRKRNVEELDLSSAKRPQSRDEHMEDAPASVPATGRRVLHSGLTGGLTRLVTDPEFYEDRIDAGPTPISPIKRRKEGRSEGKETSRKVSHGSSKVSASTKHSHRDRDRSRSPERERRHRRRRSASVSSTEDRRRRPPPRGQEQRALEYSGERAGSVQPNANNQLMGPNDRADHFMSFITKGPESERGCSINKALKRYHRERDVRGDGEKEEEDKELWKSLRLRRNSRGEIVLFC